MPPKNYLVTLIKIYHECVVLLAYSGAQGQPMDLSSSAKTKDVVQAMINLCNQALSSLALSEETKTVWANQQAMLLVADDPDMLLKIFEQIKALLDKPQILATQTSNIKKNILVSKYTIKLDDDDDDDLEKSPPSIAKSFTVQLDFEEPTDASAMRTAPIAQPSSLLKQAIRNSNSKNNTIQPTDYQPLYRQYLLMQENYQNMFGTNSNNNANPNQSIATMSQPELIQAIINIIGKIQLVNLEGFLLAESKAKLNKLQLTLKKPGPNCNYFSLFSNYATILSKH